MEKWCKEILETPIRFGLVQQGHIPTIYDMIEEEKSWEEIADAIGGEANTARDHFIAYLLAENAALKKELGEFPADHLEAVEGWEGQITALKERVAEL